MAGSSKNRPNHGIGTGHRNGSYTNWGGGLDIDISEEMFRGVQTRRTSPVAPAGSHEVLIRSQIKQDITDNKQIKAVLQQRNEPNGGGGGIGICALLFLFFLLLALLSGTLFLILHTRKPGTSALPISIRINNTTNITCGKGTTEKKGVCVPDLAWILRDHPALKLRSTTAMQCPNIQETLCEEFTSDARNANRSLVTSFLKDYADLWASRLITRPGDDLLAKAFSLCNSDPPLQSKVMDRLLKELSLVKDRNGLVRIMGLWSALDIPSVFDVLILPDPRALGAQSPVLAFVPQRRFLSQARAAVDIQSLPDKEKTDFLLVWEYLRYLYHDSIPAEYRTQTLNMDFVSYVTGGESASWSNLSRDLLPLTRFRELMLKQKVDLATFFSGLNDGLLLVLDSTRTQSTIEERIASESLLAWAFRSDFFTSFAFDSLSVDKWKNYLLVCLKMEAFKHRQVSSVLSLSLPEDYFPQYVYSSKTRQCTVSVQNELHILVNKHLIQELETPGSVLDPNHGSMIYLHKLYGDLVTKFQSMVNQSILLSAHARERISLKLGSASLVIGSSVSHNEIARNLASPKSFLFNTYGDVLWAARAARKHFELDHRYLTLIEENDLRKTDCLLSPIDDFLSPSIRYYPTLNSIVVHPMMMVPLLYPPALDQTHRTTSFLLETVSRMGWYLARELARSMDRYASNFDEKGHVSARWLYESQDLSLYDQLYASFPQGHSPSECIAERLAFCAVYGVLLDHSNNISDVSWMKQMFWNSVAIECGGMASSMQWCISDSNLYRRAFECSANTTLTTLSCLDELFSPRVN